MYSLSTQCQYWMFPNEDELRKLASEANAQFIKERCGHLSVNLSDKTIYDYYLSPNDERILCKYYETILRDFCRKFQPPMPQSVVGTAFQYFKRFYLNNSVMNYHPKHIVVTCVYLACKVEEFNVSMTQFVANIKGDREKAANVILDNELLLMQQLKYHLNIHNAFRPIEGFLIDLKTRYPINDDYEKLRPHIDNFIEKSFFTNSCFLFSPSQIALSAILYASGKLQVNLDSYITELLMADNPNKMQHLHHTMSTILTLMMNYKEVTPKEHVKAIEKKLELCRNQSNNPDSHEYKRTFVDDMNEDTVTYEKYAKLSEEQKRIDEMYIESHASNKKFP